MIHAQKIWKNFRGLEILRDASLEVKKGSITLLTGANGSGKSTLLKILTGLIPATSGTARIGGFDIRKHRRSAQRLLSFLPQSIRFHPTSTPIQILKFYARLRRIPLSCSHTLLERFDLREAAKRPVNKLSGGMLQRLGLALMMLPDSPLLILDEPGLSLDPDWRESLRDILREEARKGKTVLLTSHFAPEWKDIYDAIFDCRDGQILADSPSPSHTHNHHAS